MCPTCRTELERNDGSQVYSRCPKCRGIWIAERDLEEYVRRCVQSQGINPGIIALQETPTKAASRTCPTCARRSLDTVKLRAVSAAKCEKCEGVFLASGAAELIAERVLVSEREWTLGRKVTGNLKLDEILKHPSRFGNPT